jgi:outer membrane protein OmpA-like peptidoglycan-associated protein
MKIQHIPGVLTVLFLPLIVAGQDETYSVNLARFNSKKSDEFSPVYYRNGIVFCSNRNQSLFMNYTTSENKGLLKINFVDTVSGKVRLFSKNLRTRFNDGPASFSRSADTIYFSRNLKIDGDLKENSPRNKLGIFTAVRENNSWGKILDVRFNTEYYNIMTPFISPDGKRLFFASDNPDGIGGTDIYYCDWKGDYWGDPVNLGPGINTSGNESYPSVNREGGLFFASDGHPGLGGKDIFYTKQLNNKWLPPVHLDAPINSKYDDFALIADSVMNNGFFSSKRDNSVDIYRFKTNIHQLFYCDNQRVNQYCFKFSDEGKIPVDGRYLQLVWNFGDGSTATGQNVEHCFKGPGKYPVKLDALDKKTGRVFFSKLSYDLDLRDIEQPVIISPASGLAGEPANFNGLTSNFPGSEILNYTWYFGDGDRSKGELMKHTYFDKGDYEVKLGLTVRNSKTGVIHEACAVKPIKIFSDKMEKSAYDKREIKPAPVINILDYDHAITKNVYSTEKYANQDIAYRVEIVNSKTKLALDNQVFRNVPRKYSIKEEYLPGEKIYSYVIDEESSLMATYPSYNEITGLGYTNARVTPFNIEDPASKELNNLEKVFGVSTDVFFKKSDFSLTSEGTQLLDLVLGLLSKYPSIKLEIASHTDNVGLAASNQYLSQKRAEAMVNYLVINGINRLRLTAKGYGGTRPVAPNYQESDRKLNRRIDFTILENTPK